MLKQTTEYAIIMHMQFSQPAMQRLILATHNPHKVAELNALLHAYTHTHTNTNTYIQTTLSNHQIQYVAEGIADLAPCPEPHHTFLENALAKARHACAHKHALTLADDSGLCIPALNGAPGVHSARFANLHPTASNVISDYAHCQLPIFAGDNIHQNNVRAVIAAIIQKNLFSKAEIKEALSSFEAAKAYALPAYYHCVLVCIHSVEHPHVLTVQANWHGQFILHGRGEQGFGYDGHFYLPELKQTAAELSTELKNQLSHRGRAMRELLGQLATNLKP